MSHLSPRKTGFALGGLVGFMHLVWSFLVALGLAQGWIDWIIELHMIQDSHTVLPFSLPSAITLVIVTAIVGAIGGSLFAVIWNRIQK